jgi:hypothetical protein
MSLKIPQNQIVKSKYTSGHEYVFSSTYKLYQGYYYEMNGKIFAGKEFNINNPELVSIKSTIINTLLTKASTYVYGKISKNIIPTSVPKPHFFQYDSEVRYYSYQTNQNLIKEINEASFNDIQSNPLYKTVFLSFKGGFNKDELAVAEKTIPGITTFTETSYMPPKVEESGLVG